MDTVLAHKQVTTRKPHKCWGCWTSFPSDSQMTVHSVARDGAVSHAYTCRQWQDWIDQNTEDWRIEDWESALPGHIGYWKDNEWHPQHEE